MVISTFLDPSLNCVLSNSVCYCAEVTVYIRSHSHHYSATSWLVTYTYRIFFFNSYCFFIPPFLQMQYQRNEFTCREGNYLKCSVPFLSTWGLLKKFAPLGEQTYFLQRLFCSCKNKKCRSSMNCRSVDIPPPLQQFLVLCTKLRQFEKWAKTPRIYLTILHAEHLSSTSYEFFPWELPHVWWHYYSTRTTVNVRIVLCKYISLEMYLQRTIPTLTVKQAKQQWHQTWGNDGQIDYCLWCPLQNSSWWCHIVTLSFNANNWA